MLSVSQNPAHTLRMTSINHKASAQGHDYGLSETRNTSNQEDGASGNCAYVSPQGLPRGVGSLDGRASKVELRILFVVWGGRLTPLRLADNSTYSYVQICCFLDRQVEKSFTDQNNYVEKETHGARQARRQTMANPIISFYAARLIGTWVSLSAMLVEEMSQIIATSIFISGMSANLPYFRTLNKVHIGLLTSFLNWYSTQYSSIRPICYFFSGLAGSSLMPAVLLLSASCFRKSKQPLYAIIWGTAIPLALVVGDLNLYIGSAQTNLLISVQGIMFCIVSLAIEPWMFTARSLMPSWHLFDSPSEQLQADRFPSALSRFRDICKSGRKQVNRSKLPISTTRANF